MPQPTCPDCQAQDIHEQRTALVRVFAPVILLDIHGEAVVGAEDDAEQERLDTEDDHEYVCGNCGFTAEDASEFLPTDEEDE